MPPSAFEQFMEQIFQLRIREWSPDQPMPAFLTQELDLRHKIDFATDLALLPQLYGTDYDNVAFTLLEAFLWSRAGKESLKELGWLEGNIVIADFSNARA